MLPSLSALARCFHANASMYVKWSRVCSVISEIHIRYCLKGMFNEKKKFSSVVASSAIYRMWINCSIGYSFDFSCSARNIRKLATWISTKSRTIPFNPWVGHFYFIFYNFSMIYADWMLSKSEFIAATLIFHPMRLHTKKKKDGECW